MHVPCDPAAHSFEDIHQKTRTGMFQQPLTKICLHADVLHMSRRMDGQLGLSPQRNTIEQQEWINKNNEQTVNKSQKGKTGQKKPDLKDTYSVILFLEFQE